MKKSSILIGLSACILLALIVGIILLASNKKSASDTTANPDRFDPTFDMMDPENPMTQVDLIAKRKAEYSRLKKENDDLSRYLQSLAGKQTEITNLAPPKNVATTRPTPELESFLWKHSVPGLFDVLDDEADGYRYNLENNISETHSYYIAARKKHGSQLQSRLAEMGLPEKTAVRYIYPDSYNYYNYTADDTAENRVPALKFTSLESIQNDTKNTLAELLKKLTERKEKITIDMADARKDYSERIKKYADSRFDMSGKAISLGIPAFAAIAVFLYGAGLYGRNKIRQEAGANGLLNKDLHEYLNVSTWHSVYLITVLLLIITIFILGLGRLIQENTLAALLGGIAGYVLNNRMTAPSSGTQLQKQ